MELSDELLRLQDLTGFARELRVVFSPGGSDVLEGEVKGDVVFVYSDQAALDTLRHEFVDYVVSQAASAYVHMVNMQRGVLNAILADMGKRAYEQKERCVEALLHLVRSSGRK